MRPDRLGFMPAQIRVYIHRTEHKREREYIICYSTNEAETVREAKRMSDTGNHLIAGPGGIDLTGSNTVVAETSGRA